MICSILFAANIAVEQAVKADAITIALLMLYLRASDVGYSNTARSIESRSETLLVCSEALTSEVGLSQNFRAYKRIPLSSEF